MRCGTPECRAVASVCPLPRALSPCPAPDLLVLAVPVLGIQVFVELNELMLDRSQEPHWRETARWIKFEEDVEEETERWGKPHVASLSFRSLLELRRTIAHGGDLGWAPSSPHSSAWAGCLAPAASPHPWAPEPRQDLAAPLVPWRSHALAACEL